MTPTTKHPTIVAGVHFTVDGQHGAKAEAIYADFCRSIIHARRCGIRYDGDYERQYDEETKRPLPERAAYDAKLQATLKEIGR